MNSRGAPTARSLRDPVHLVALGFGSGLVPFAPGTAGSLVALLPAWLTLTWPLEWRAALVLGAFGLGIWLCGESERRLGAHDPRAIVFDEIVGMLATALALPARAAWLIPAFVLFRVFDIVKPWPIRDIDHRLGGGAGIMLDDLMAAAYAAVCLLIARALLPIT